MLDSFPVVEVCIDDPRSLVSVLSASQISSIELCTSLVEGGMTPSMGMIKLTRSLVPSTIFLNVLIRPRPGDFLYSEVDKLIIEEDVRVCKELGVDGIVFGALTANGEIDVELVDYVMKLASPMKMTFHRAFDLCKDAKRSFLKLEEMRVPRLLTSGQAATAMEGLELIEWMLSESKYTKIAVGGGVNGANAAKFGIYFE